MKPAFSLAAIVALLLAASARAGDGNVPPETLRPLGLAGIKTVSDEEGLQVRGLSGAAWTKGASLVNGLLIEPETQSFVFGSDANKVAGFAETVCPYAPADVNHTTSSGVDLSLNVTTPTGTFSGTLIGGAGGSGRAWAK